MEAFFDFIRTNQVIALLAAILIFFVTTILVARGLIGFGITVLLLTFSIAAGLVINHHDDFQYCFRDSSQTVNHSNDSQSDFETVVLRAMDDLKAEVKSGKESLEKVVTQVQEIFEEVDLQKQKLESFIEEAREHFKTEQVDEPAQTD